MLPNRFEELRITLPKKLFAEVDILAKHENKDINELIYHATKSYIEYKHEVRELHETMQKGYVEMAKINLHLCSEAFLAEEEAENTYDRLVIGV